MRFLFSGCLAAGLLASQMAFAQSCARPADKTAFDVTGLKSQLMVTAITCSATERYNAFVMRYRPNLMTQDKVLTAYFARNFGHRAQAQHDDYITSLANTQSEDGLKSGTAFCAGHMAMFDQVMALHSPAELADFAGNQSIVQPIALVACAEPARRAVIRQASAAPTPRRSH